MSKRLDPAKKEFRRKARRAFERVLRSGMAGWSATSECGTVSVSSASTSVRIDSDTVMVVCFSHGPNVAQGVAQG